LVLLSPAVALVSLAGGCRPSAPIRKNNRPDGAWLYATYCAQCHGTNARNDRGGANPQMRLSAFTEMPPDRWRRVVLRGRGAMPSFAGRLQPDEVDTIASTIKGILKYP
jgi:mono/diheme cytochrome c family protein